MPAQSLTTERYVVYSVDGTDDLKSNSSTGSRESITFTSPDYVDLSLRKLPNGRGGHDNLLPSPAPSTPTTDKWGSYWSTRERCCCFWNFVLIVALAVLATIVILVSKGMMDLRKPEDDSAISNERFASADVTLTAVTCVSPKPEPKMCTDDACLRLTTGILQHMNLSVDPCQDFYTYACGGFTNTAQVTWSSPRIRVNPDIIERKYYEDVMDAVSDNIAEEDSVETKTVKKIFMSCIRHTDTPISQVLDLLDELGGFEWSASGGPTQMTKPMTLTELIAETAVRFGTFVLFDVEVNSDRSLAIYNRFSDGFIQRRMEERAQLKRFRYLRPSDYIYRDENTDELLQAYKTYIGQFLGYILGINGTGMADRRYSAMIDDIYHLDVYINRVLYAEDSGNLSEGMTKCTNKMSLDDIQYQYSYNISWRRVFDAVFTDDNNNTPKAYNICYVALDNAINDVLSEFSFKSVKQYILYSLLVNSELFTLLPLDKPVFKQPQWTGSAFRENFLNSGVRGDSGCVHLISNYIPISHVIYSRIPTVFENRITNLFHELVTSLEGIISDMYWVPAQQKRHLMTALRDLEIRFEWEKDRDIFALKAPNMTSDFFHNFIEMLRYDSTMYLRGYKQRKRYASDSVLYLNSKTLEVPSLVLYIPLVDTSAFPSTWYGAAGTLLSGTISELFDIDGLLRFLTEDKIDHRVALTIAFRLQCLVDEYSKYVIHEEGETRYKVKGDITKSANFGDSLALRVAYHAYTKHRNVALPSLPGMSFTNDQLFFLTYAQTMCEKSNTRGLYKHYIDVTEPHQSPGKFRVLGTLSNFKKFAEAYSCDTSNHMNPQDKCTLF